MKVRLPVPLGTLLLAALVLLALSWWDGRTGGEDQRTIDAARNALAAGKAYRVSQARLLAIAQATGTRAERHRAVAEARDTTVHRLETMLGLATTVRDSVGILLIEVHTLKAQVADWRAAYADLMVKAWADSTRADRAEARVADLERHLANVIEVADCHLLGLGFMPRCPSRTLSFALGAGAGFVGGVVVQ